MNTPPLRQVLSFPNWTETPPSRVARRCAAAPFLVRVVPFVFALLMLLSLDGLAAANAEQAREHLRKARIFLAAGDYRRALDACERQVEEVPSVESYVYLTYVLQALDGFLESLAQTEQWLRIEHLYLSLLNRRSADLTDPIDVLPRIAKELLQDSVRKQADITATMAARLDGEVVKHLWRQQAAWRSAKPEQWWFGVPTEWKW